MAVELERYGAGIYGVKGIYPNVDFYSGIVYQAMGIPTDLFTPIFAIARVAGWLAHWLEQLNNNRIFRPEQIYVGKTDVPYVPLEKRAEHAAPASGRVDLEFEPRRTDNRRTPGGLTMPETTNPPPAPETPRPAYGKADSILFQAWLVLFLLVICFALVNYLISYI